MHTGRWRLELIEQIEQLPVPWRRPPRRAATPPPPGAHAVGALLDAFDLLAHRGPGNLAWAASFRHDPVAFLLDTMSDAINLWSAEGELLYRNRAATELGIVGRCDGAPLEVFSAGGRRFERRCLCCLSHGTEYVLEIIRAVQ